MSEIIPISEEQTLETVKLFMAAFGVIIEEGDRCDLAIKNLRAKGYIEKSDLDFFKERYWNVHMAQTIWAVHEYIMELEKENKRLKK